MFNGLALIGCGFELIGSVFTILFEVSRLTTGELIFGVESSISSFPKTWSFVFGILIIASIFNPVCASSGFSFNILSTLVLYFFEIE